MSVTRRGSLRKGRLERLWSRVDGFYAGLIFGRKRGSPDSRGSGPFDPKPPAGGDHRFVRMLRRNLRWTYYLHLPGLYWFLYAFSHYYVNYPWLLAGGAAANLVSTWLTIIYVRLDLEGRGARFPRLPEWASNLVSLVYLGLGLLLFAAFLVLAK